MYAYPTWQRGPDTETVTFWLRSSITTRRQGPRRRVHWTSPRCSTSFGFQSRCVSNFMIFVPQNGKFLVGSWHSWCPFWTFACLLACLSSGLIPLHSPHGKDKASEYWNQAIRI